MEHARRKILSAQAALKNSPSARRRLTATGFRGNSCLAIERDHKFSPNITYFFLDQRVLKCPSTIAVGGGLFLCLAGVPSSIALIMTQSD